MSDAVQRISDAIDPARARAPQAALGHAPQIGPGDALPPFFHQLYFWDPRPPARLGRDGHPRVGGIIPDMGLPRRMWAGGRRDFAAPFRAGVAAERVSHVERTEPKQGRSGRLGFVTLRHEVWQRGRRVLSEWQELVYRQDPGPGAAPMPPRAATDEDIRETVRFDSTLLFRYSALTFNGHRIHYDIDYARQVEGYGGLVVHGPLLAQLLMLLAARRMGGLARFSFRATAPLIHSESADLCWKSGGMLWVRGPDGRQCMQADAHGPG